MRNAHKLADALGLPASILHYPDGTTEMFVHTDARALDKSLSPLERSLYQALEFAKHHKRRRGGSDKGGGTHARPKEPVSS